MRGVSRVINAVVPRSGMYKHRRRDQSGAGAKADRFSRGFHRGCGWRLIKRNFAMGLKKSKIECGMDSEKLTLPAQAGRLHGFFRAVIDPFAFGIEFEYLRFVWTVSFRKQK